MKKLVLIAFSAIISFTSFSQVGIKGGFTLGVTLNQGNSQAMPGFDLGVVYNLSDNFRAEILFEGMFQNRSNGFTTSRHTFMPVTIGADYRFLDGKFHPFVGFNLGSYTFSNRIGNMKVSDTYFGLHPKIGLNYDVNENIVIDFTAKYHVAFMGKNAGNIQNLGLNFGVIYMFN